jgi:opacity protein-like surface antigen
MIAFKRKLFLAVLALPMAAMLLLPGMVWGGMWVGLQAGLNYIPNTNIVEKPFLEEQRTYENVKFDVNFLGGLTVGYDFVNEGFLYRAWPDWMKYFSLVLDSTYENISFQHQRVTVAVLGNGFSTTYRRVLELSPGGKISMFYLTPMIIGKYGFIPNAEIPFGQLQPYLGVGAGIVISNPEVSGLTTRVRNKLDVSLAVESGLRYMLLRNVSLDAAFRYRIIPSQFGNSYNATGDTEKIDLDFNPKLYGAILRVSYHF